MQTIPGVMHKFVIRPRASDWVMRVKYVNNAAIERDSDAVLGDLVKRS